MAKKKSALGSELSAAAIWPAEELPFVREILAQPHDDAPRLVFADWLEERGDPRAEFIRVQCRLAKLRIRDPEYAALEAHSHTLEAKYRTRWIAAYPKLPGMLWGIDLKTWSGRTNETDQIRHFFRRGLVATARCQTFHLFRELLPGLVRELGVSELQLDLSQKSARELCEVAGLEHVEALLLSKMAATDSSPLLESPRLGPIWRLDLEYSAEAQAALEAFLARDQSRALRWLNLHGATPDEAEPLRRWKHLGELDILDVRHDPTGLIEALGDSRLRPSYVPLCYDDTARQFADWCKRLATAPAMSEAVRMSLCQVHDDRAFEGLKLPPKVTTLEIDGEFGATGARLLAQSPTIQQLQELQLFCLTLQDAGLEALAAGRWKNLRTLEVRTLGVTYRAIETLVQALPRVEHLTLHWCQITTEQKAKLRRMFPGKLTI